MTGTIIILLIVCGVVFFMMNKKKSDSSKEKIPSTRPASIPYAKDELRIENVEAGGMIHISGIGPNVDEYDVNVIARHLYRQGGSTWYELEGESTEDKVWIDLEEDDGLELTITLKKMKLRDVDLNKEKLDEIDDEEDGEIVYEGEKYYYEDSDRAMYYKYGDENKGERFYYWDFENKAGDKFIGVEKWEDGAYDVSYSESIAPHQVTVFSLKK